MRYNMCIGGVDVIGHVILEGAEMKPEERRHIQELRRQALLKDAVQDAESNIRERNAKQFTRQAELRDKARNSNKPITTADIAEVQMDLVLFGKGRDIDEKF